MRSRLFWSDMYRGRDRFVRLIDPWNWRHRPGLIEMWLQDIIDHWLISSVRGKADFGPALATAYGHDFAYAVHTHESGQLLLRKSRCLDALAALIVLNSNTKRPIVYAGLHGDKDTFRVAFAAVGAPYHEINSPPLLGGAIDGRSGVFHDTCFVQPGLDGLPLFLHYCGRQREDDDARRGEAQRRPEHCMTAEGRPFRLWPRDARRGYMRGRVMLTQGS